MKLPLHVCTRSLLALGLLAASARADFTDYFNLDAGTVSGNASATPGPPTLIGDPSGPKYGGQWRLEAIGSVLNPNPTVTFQRSPGSLSIPAMGFTLAAPAHSTVQLWIPPYPNSPLVFVMFNCSMSLKPGSQVTIEDCNVNLLSRSEPGLFCTSLMANPAILEGPMMGMMFELRTGASSDILQVVGWDLTRPPRLLKLTRTNDTLVLSWPSHGPDCVLQENHDLADSRGWTAPGYPVNDDGINKSVTLPAPTGNLFFRLVER